MRINENIVTAYTELAASLGEMLNKYRVTQKEVAAAIGMPHISFTRKLKKNTFSPDEVLKICKYINQLP